MIRRHELGFWQGPMSSPRARSRFALEIAQPRTCTPCVVRWDNSQPQASGSYAGIAAQVALQRAPWCAFSRLGGYPARTGNCTWRNGGGRMCRGLGVRTSTTREVRAPRVSRSARSAGAEVARRVVRRAVLRAEQRVRASRRLRLEVHVELDAPARRVDDVVERVPARRRRALEALNWCGCI